MGQQGNALQTAWHNMGVAVGVSDQSLYLLFFADGILAKVCTGFICFALRGEIFYGIVFCKRCRGIFSAAIPGALAIVPPTPAYYLYCGVWFFWPVQIL